MPPGNDSRPSRAGKPYNQRWKQARLTYLKRNPLCVMCKAQGKLKAAEVVDHIKPHRGSTQLFWDTSNWQGLCSHHHNSTKQSIEKGRTQGCDAQGNPIDSDHHWLKE